MVVNHSWKDSLSHNHVYTDVTCMYGNNTGFKCLHLIASLLHLTSYIVIHVRVKSGWAAKGYSTFISHYDTAAV